MVCALWTASRCRLPTKQSSILEKKMRPVKAGVGGRWQNNLINTHLACAWMRVNAAHVRLNSETFAMKANNHDYHNPAVAEHSVWGWVWGGGSGRLGHDDHCVRSVLALARPFLTNASISIFNANTHANIHPKLATLSQVVQVFPDFIHQQAVSPGHARHVGAVLGRRVHQLRHVRQNDSLAGRGQTQQVQV
jgi:hypothetical protein